MNIINILTQQLRQQYLKHIRRKFVRPNRNYTLYQHFASLSDLGVFKWVKLSVYVSLVDGCNHGKITATIPDMGVRVCTCVRAYVHLSYLGLYYFTKRFLVFKIKGKNLALKGKEIFWHPGIDDFNKL